MSEVVLSLEGVTFAYHDQPVLEDIHLQLERGTFLGLIGPNGSGKTTLLKVALGLLRPQRGVVRWFGQPLTPGRGAGLRVGYVPQARQGFAADFPATVAEVVATGRVPRRGLFRRLGRRDWQAVDQALAAVGMAGHGDRRIRELSGGQQQRVLIARALAGEPEVLLLDEPTAGIDVAGQESFYDLLGELHAARGLTLVLVSHDVAMITRHVTHLACLNRRLHYHGDVKGFLRGQMDLARIYGGMHWVAHDHPEALAVSQHGQHGLGLAGGLPRPGRPDLGGGCL